MLTKLILCYQCELYPSISGYKNKKGHFILSDINALSSSVFLQSIGMHEDLLHAFHLTDKASIKHYFGIRKMEKLFVNGYDLKLLMIESDK